MAPASKTAPSAPAAGGPGAAGEPGLFLIDGNSLVYRAFFALPESIATSTGFPTNAIFGFASMLVKILTEYGSRPTVVAWDAGSSGRKELYEEYKAQRRERPDLLGQQWPHMEPLVEAFGYRNVKVEGYEADDVIASIAEHARERAVPVMIVSGDRDVFQLIDEEGLVKVMATSRGITETKVYDRQAVIDRYGIPPELIPDFYGLKGDTSDNIPGVPGIGDKTASELLSRFGGLEEVLASVDQISGAKRKQNLIDHAEDARISKQLATMVRDIDPGFDALEESSREPDRSRLRDVFREFELRDPLRRLEEALGDAEAAAPAPAAEHQLSGRFRSASLADLEKLPAESELAVAVRAPAAPEGALFAEAGPWGFGVCVNAAGEDVPEVLFGECPDPAALVSACGDRPVIAHDAKSLDRVPPRLVHDTMLGAYLLEPARRGYPFRELSEERGLAAASPGPELGGTSPAVDPGNGPGPGGNGANAAGADAAALAAGAAQDALLVAALADWQRAELAKRGLEPLMRDIELPLVPVLRAMELTGVKLNTDRLAGITHRVRDEVAELEREIWSLAGEEFVIGSPQQLAEVLFVKLGLSRKRRGKTGFSTDARVLQAIRTEHPIIPKIERWRELSTLAKTYLDVLPQLTDERGRIHTTFLQAVAQTGRLSSTNPNMQNVPIRTPLGREIRGCFEAQEGNLLLSADYSQIELRVLAHAADEPVLEEIFQRGEDVHSATAAQVFQVATDQIDPGMRSKAKMINYGIVYGLSDFGLADRLNIPREEARAFIEAYLERFPRVAQFMKDTIATAAEVGHVSTLWGRRRQIPELRARNWQVRSLGERLAVNTVIQGTAADIIKLAMVRCHAALAREQLSTDLILTIHDELLFEGPADEMPAARELVEREMCAVWEHDPPLGVDIGVGSTWLEAK
ncbi:MAG TPA: DNA polymerase I [Solirubrobacteraceae bacterium]|nr:DNA polymerase I [Solirubrobacteraceae bacterium]